MAIAETAPQRHNIVVAGFLGSGHERLGQAVANLLDYEAVDSYTFFAQNALRRGDFEDAAASEIAVLHGMAERDEPSVVSVRASTFCRTEAREAIGRLGALTAYVEMPSNSCRRGLEAIRRRRLERAAAETELGIYSFDNVHPRARDVANIHVKPRLDWGSSMGMVARSLVRDFAEKSGLFVPVSLGAAATKGALTTRGAIVSRGATILRFPVRPIS